MNKKTVPNKTPKNIIKTSPPKNKTSGGKRLLAFGVPADALTEQALGSGYRFEARVPEPLPVATPAPAQKLQSARVRLPRVIGPTSREVFTQALDAVTSPLGMMLVMALALLPKRRRVDPGRDRTSHPAE